MIMKKSISAIALLLISQFSISQVLINKTEKTVKSKTSTEAPAVNLDDSMERETVKKTESNQSLVKEYKEIKQKNISNQYKKVNNSTQNKLNEIVTKIETNDANSYEFHYLKWENGNYDVNQFHHLETAYKLNPNNHELLDDFIAYYELTENDLKKKEFCKKLNRLKPFSKNLMNYNRNVLNSLEKNAILITYGKDDTYPIWVLQEVNGLRKDVLVLNYDLLQKEDYKQKTLSDKGISSNTSAKNFTQFISNLSKQNNKPIYVGLTVPRSTISSNKNRLYLTGLAFKLSESKINNVSLLKTNWEKKINIKNIENRTSFNAVESNYLLPLLTLYKTYVKEGQNGKAKKVESLALSIAKNNGKLKTVEQYILSINQKNK